MKNLNDKLIQSHLKNNFLKLVLFVSLVISLFTGCQSSKKGDSDYVDISSNPSYWVFKTNVYSAKKNKNISGYTHITYINPKLIRIDIYDPLGLLNAGTLIYKDGNFEAVMPLERKYFFGTATPETMFQILKSPVDPALFTNIIFQKKLTDKNWECVTDEKNYVRDCRNRNAGMDIVWKKNMSDSDGWVQITHNEGEVELKLRNSKTIKPLPESKFKLQVPNSYAKFKVDQSGIKKL